MIKFRNILLIGFTLLLSGCKMAIFDPKGMIALREMHLLIDATLLMLIVVVPVILLSFIFAWRYRASNTKAKYTPEWSHSYLLESIWWAIPIIIIGVLAVITWVTSHSLDPYKPIASKKKTITIEVVALDWKWLFIYPKQHIATVNYIQIPVNVPVRFLITADAPMNSLEIPRLAGQIYAMPGMRTRLYIIANAQGSYHGFSANFSGPGFTNMKFIVRASTMGQFERWVANVQKAPNRLTLHAYHHLALDSENNPVQYFSWPEKNLFNKVIKKYMGPDMPKMKSYH